MCFVYISINAFPMEKNGDGSKPWYLLFTPSHSWVKMDVHPTKNVSIAIDPYQILATTNKNIEKMQQICTVLRRNPRLCLRSSWVVITSAGFV
jgi:hypothetical protein